MPLPRSHAFDLKLPAGCTGDDIIDSGARHVTLQEIYMAVKNYQVTLNTPSAVTTLLQFKNIRLEDQLVPSCLNHERYPDLSPSTCTAKLLKSEMAHSRGSPLFSLAPDTPRYT